MTYLKRLIHRINIAVEEIHAASDETFKTQLKNKALDHYVDDMVGKAMRPDLRLRPIINAVNAAMQLE